VTRRTWTLATTAAVAAGIAGTVAVSGDTPPAAATGGPAPTAQVERGRLSALVSGAGILTYRARPDGSPYAVVDQAPGVFTRLPETGDRIPCGGVLYRVDERPVVLLCGTIPAYRDLHAGATGMDVRQLNRSLHVRGSGATFTAQTREAVQALQRRLGLTVTGTLAPADAVFLPEAVRIAKVTAEIGGPARPGAPVLTATSDRLHVRVDLDAAQQGKVRKGDRVQITLPGNTPVTGRVATFGRVAQAEQGSPAASATIPTFIDLDDPRKAGGLDQAPVGVDITIRGVDNALSVPVTALVGRSGGGFAVEVVHSDGRRELVAVRLGLFDTGGGRVQVEGDLEAGDDVVVPAL
jgi:hypothetical protein